MKTSKSVKVGTTTLTVKKRAPRWTQDQIKILLTAAIDQRETLTGKFRGHSSGHGGAERDKVYEEIALKVSANSIAQRDGHACADKLRCFTSECKNKWIQLVEKHNKTGSGGLPDPKEYLSQLELLALEYLGGTNIEGVQYQEATAMSDEDEEEVTQNILAVKKSIQGNESAMTDTVPGPGSMGKRRLFDATPTRSAERKNVMSELTTIKQTVALVHTTVESQGKDLKAVNDKISSLVTMVSDFISENTQTTGKTSHKKVEDGISIASSTSSTELEKTLCVSQLPSVSAESPPKMSSLEHRNAMRHLPPEFASMTCEQPEDIKHQIVEAIDDLLNDMDKSQKDAWVVICEKTKRDSSVLLAEKKALKVFDLLKDDDVDFIMRYTTTKMPALSNKIAKNKMLSLIIGELVSSEAIVLGVEKEPSVKEVEGKGKGRGKSTRSGSLSGVPTRGKRLRQK